ncbi:MULTISPECIES: endonuclease/exonuclease/phosphatase family protein [Chryseobacterium]|uniref:Uncharacterized protein conserved in bacteria n=1 Tax=Chryseobacterium taihuense TaxID=1141221 RepID=A0A4U8WFF9_9FLAO|nr:MULTISPECIES: endonuclease/exonuclease/phosphatase family protein [Chryseobacterium]QQV02631.1 endonuclease/exonuclease/phosphatase family protein [Chryseobacterium sp. FDAARGOS 1104]VFB04110.1 Uncharacterized protein conserved in bacteria [Chryseobacterium taihuense]
MKKVSVLFVLHLFVVLLLAATLTNQWVAPNLFASLNFLSLLFPYLIIIHIVFTTIWFFRAKKTAVIFLMSTIIFIQPIRRWINISAPPQENLSRNKSVKIITYNVKYGSKGWENVRRYIRSHDADVILVQEKDTNRNFREDLVKYPAAILKTKHKILNQQDLLKDTSKGSSFFADLEIKGETIRVVNVYLEPFRVTKSMIGMKDEDNPSKERHNILTLFCRLTETFKAHENQVKKIRTAVENSPYPVILAGDFNAVPNSWEYYNLGQNLNDAFLQSGCGSSTTFHDFKLPLRLDYIFTSKNIKAISYKIDYSVKLSDHYPVIAEFIIN